MRVSREDFLQVRFSRLVKVIGVKVGFKLTSHNSHKDFGPKRKFKDWLVIVGVPGSSPGFFVWGYSIGLDGG